MHSGKRKDRNCVLSWMQQFVLRAVQSSITKDFMTLHPCFCW